MDISSLLFAKGLLRMRSMKANVALPDKPLIKLVNSTQSSFVNTDTFLLTFPKYFALEAPHALLKVYFFFGSLSGIFY